MANKVLFLFIAFMLGTLMDPLHKSYHNWKSGTRDVVILFEDTASVTTYGVGFPEKLLGMRAQFDSAEVAYWLRRDLAFLVFEMRAHGYLVKRSVGAKPIESIFGHKREGGPLGFVFSRLDGAPFDAERELDTVIGITAKKLGLPEPCSKDVATKVAPDSFWGIENTKNMIGRCLDANWYTVPYEEYESFVAANGH